MERSVHGNVMHMVIDGGGVVNNFGTIMHLDCKGGAVTVRNNGTIMHNKGSIVGSSERVVYRDRVVYRNRDRPSESATKRALEEIARLKDANAILRSKLQSYERDESGLHNRIAELEENIKGILEANREYARHLDYLLKGGKPEDVWDDYKPTKAECEQVYNMLKIFLDCED